MSKLRKFAQATNWPHLHANDPGPHWPTEARGRATTEAEEGSTWALQSHSASDSWPREGLRGQRIKTDTVRSLYG